MKKEADELRHDVPDLVRASTRPDREPAIITILSSEAIAIS
jgi:hypothetical protein